MSNMSTVGVPPGRVQNLSKDKPLSGRKAIQIPPSSLDQAHLYVLHNTHEVVPYISDHMDWVKTYYPYQNEKWLQEEHNRTFVNWLTDKVEVYISLIFTKFLNHIFFST